MPAEVAADAPAGGLQRLLGAAVLLVLLLLGAAAALGAGTSALPMVLVLLALALLAALLLTTLALRRHAAALARDRRLEAMLDRVSDFLWEADARGRIVSISPSFEARTGRPVAEFLRIGEPGGPQIVADAEFEALQADLRAQRPYRDRTISFRCADGSPLIVCGSAEPLRDDAGRLTGWWGMSRNVTAERAAQRALDRSQALLDNLVRMAPEAIAVARVDGGTIVLANPAYLRMARMSEAQVIGKSALELGLWRSVHEQLRLRDALAAGPVHDLRSEIWIDGQPREALLAAAAFESDGDRLAVISVRDITDSERARRENDAILDNASVGIAFIRDRRFERVNPAFETMFGCAPGSLAGQPTRVLCADDDDSAEAFMRDTDAVLLAGGTVDIEHRLRRADGSPLVARLLARPLDAGRARERGIIWIAEDITERRRAELELAEAKRQAEDASRAKSAFLATMSHEIRTPLNAVLGLARLLNDEPIEDTRRRTWLGHLTGAAEQLAGIVSDVLDLSKIESGHLELEQIGFDLHAVLADTFGSFGALGRERGLSMHCEIDPAVPARVRGDPVRVRQIVANYLSNALKFTERGDVRLRATLRPGGALRLEVHDSGPGIPPEQHERLFKPFAQADGSTTRRFGGTGLGLSICRELAERMGGAVGLQARPGGGSVFWAELRLPAEGQPAACAAAPGAAPLAGLSVLVVEDNEVNRLIVGTLLRRLGAQVREAEDGEQAVACLLGGEPLPHVVLMDLHMPRLDGLAATRRLRSVALTRTLPVVALSAAVLDHERRATEAAGMNGFIPKPVEEAELLRVLQPLVPRA